MSSSRSSFIIGGRSWAFKMIQRAREEQKSYERDQSCNKTVIPSLNTVTRGSVSVSKKDFRIRYLKDHSSLRYREAQLWPTHIETGQLLSVQRLEDGQLSWDGVNGKDSSGRLVGPGARHAVPQTHLLIIIWANLRHSGHQHTSLLQLNGEFISEFTGFFSEAQELNRGNFDFMLTSFSLKQQIQNICVHTV